MDVDLEAEPGKQYLVKWCGLQYDSCTWESAADLVKWGAEAELQCASLLSSVGWARETVAVQVNTYRVALDSWRRWGTG